MNDIIMKKIGSLSSSVERDTVNVQVPGSIPGESEKEVKMNRIMGSLFFLILIGCLCEGDTKIYVGLNILAMCVLIHAHETTK